MGGWVGGWVWVSGLVVGWVCTVKASSWLSKRYNSSSLPPSPPAPFPPGRAPAKPQPSPRIRTPSGLSQCKAARWGGWVGPEVLDHGQLQPLHDTQTAHRTSDQCTQRPPHIRPMHPPISTPETPHFGSQRNPRLGLGRCRRLTQIADFKRGAEGALPTNPGSEG